MTLNHEGPVLPLSGDRLNFRLDLVEDFLRRALDDAASHGQVGAVLQEQIDLTGSHATFVNAPRSGVLVK